MIFSLAGNLISWQSTEGAMRTPTAHTFFSCTFCELACPSLLSQLFRWLQPHCHALTPRTRVAQAQHEAHLCVSSKKVSSSLLAMSYTAPLITPGTCTPSLSLTIFLTYLTYTSQRASTLCRSTTSSESCFG